MTMVCTHAGVAAKTPARAQAGPLETSSDEILIRRIADGDQLAMRALFARHRVALYRWLRRLVSDEALAEDLLSDVLLDVWRKAASFEARSSVSTWLLATLATRRCPRVGAGPTQNWTRTLLPRPWTLPMIPSSRCRGRTGQSF
jgi:sigma-70-like protein